MYVNSFGDGTDDVIVLIVDGSDMINGEFIRNHLVTPDVIIESIDDPVLGSSV